MIRPVARLVDRQRAAIERLRLAGAVRGFEQKREIVEVSRCHIGVISAEIARLVNRQGPAKQRLRFDRGGSRS